MSWYLCGMRQIVPFVVRVLFDDLRPLVGEMPKPRHSRDNVGVKRRLLEE